MTADGESEESVMTLGGHNPLMEASLREKGARTILNVKREGTEDSGARLGTKVKRERHSPRRCN